MIESLLDVLFRVVNTREGLVLNCSDVAKTKAQFYHLRSNHVELRPLTVSVSPFSANQLFIYPKEVLDEVRASGEEDS